MHRPRFQLVGLRMFATDIICDDHALSLKAILDNAGHKYSLKKDGQVFNIVQRISSEDLSLMEPAIEGKNVYASKFRDSFKELYGIKPDYTAAAGEAFQALESALKYWLGDDKGNNLGAILDWLKRNKTKWVYSAQSDAQTDAEHHFLSLIDYVNRSYRKTKHGQANKKLTIDKEPAEILIRIVAILLFELENAVKLAD